MLKTQVTPAEATSYAGSAISIVSSLTLTDIGILIGIATALLTLAVNVYFAARKDRREREEHELRMRSMERQP